MAKSTPTDLKYAAPCLVGWVLPLPPVGINFSDHSITINLAQLICDWFKLGQFFLKNGMLKMVLP